MTDTGGGFVIRGGGAADAAGLAPLLAELGYPTDAGVIADRLSTMHAADPSARVILAAQGDRLVGFATLHATPVLHRPTAVGRITGIAVLPSVQGSGVGRALVEAAEAHFREQALTRIEVTSGSLHARAYDFYRRLGYDDQGGIMTAAAVATGAVARAGIDVLARWSIRALRG